MAIPAGLNRVWVEGVYRDPDDPNEVDLWSWAQVFHVDVTSTNPNFPEPLDMQGLGNGKMNLYASGGLFSGLSKGMICTSRGAVNLLTEVSGEIVEDVDLQVIPNLACCSPQSSILLIGRTQTLGRQTRKWVPGIRRDALEDLVPKWKVPPDGFGDNLVNWLANLLRPRIYDAPPHVMIGEDVVWDAADEVMREIVEVRMQVWPRTIRQRTNDALSDSVIVPP